MAKSGKTIELVSYGVEPAYNVGQLTNLELTTILNWYNYMIDSATKKQWVLDYCKDNSIDLVPKVEKLHESYLQQIGTMTRIINLGANVDYNIDEKLIECIDKYTPTETTHNVKRHTNDKFNRLMCKVEEYIDHANVDIGVEFTELNIKADLARKVKVEIEPYITELNNIHIDAELAEYFNGIDTKPYTIRYDIVSSVCDSIIQNAKMTRVPRKAKTRKTTKNVSKVKYKTNMVEYNIQSVNPIKLIDSDIVWLYNIKTKYLQRYVADTSKSITVKGTTLKGYDENISEARRVRKPQDILTKIRTSTIKQADKVFNGLTTKPAKPTGRLNNDTIILRVK